VNYQDIQGDHRYRSGLEHWRLEEAGDDQMHRDQEGAGKRKVLHDLWAGDDGQNVGNPFLVAVLAYRDEGVAFV